MREPERLLRVVLRTPSERVLDARVAGLRVPCVSGMVGVRPGCEDMVLAVEHGLVLIRGAEDTPFAVTAGGLLDVRGGTATLLSPLALVGSSSATLLEALELALEDPDSELASRRRLGELERRIARELREVTDRRGPVS